MTGPGERTPARIVEDSVDALIGPAADDFVLTAAVGEEPPDAVELTDVERYLANGGG